ncbi:MAG: exodeoxyribonuclease VII small subunit [Paracoccaceae bacterium]|nr:exodeoxyribonuclease VII small subunit [Paracoccaceae bacterium]MDE2913565.1 exodeoxyribonuclease VII small subunit [Paracoccaceae bacterium]
MTETTDKPISEMTFEEAMAELEDVVSKLEQGQVALDDSVSLYERGAELKRHCHEKLQAAEEKVKMITLGPDRSPVGVESFDESDTPPF